MIFSEEVNGIINDMIVYAKENKYEFITPEILLLIISYKDIFEKSFSECGGDVSQLRKELEEAKTHIEELGGKVIKVEEITLPNSDINHTIIVIEKMKSTPKKFPRKKIEKK